MPSAERIRKSPDSLGVRTTAELFALKTFFFFALRHPQPAE
jgi:hypothetical protein